MLSMSTFAFIAMSLWPSCSFDISILKMSTFALPFSAAFSAMLRAKAVLPIPGLAATMTRSDFWKPPSLLSRSLNPEVTPVRLPSCMLLAEMISTSSNMISLIAV